MTTTRDTAAEIGRIVGRIEGVYRGSVEVGERVIADLAAAGFHLVRDGEAVIDGQVWTFDDKIEDCTHGAIHVCLNPPCPQPASNKEKQAAMSTTIERVLKADDGAPGITIGRLREFLAALDGLPDDTVPTARVRWSGGLAQITVIEVSP